MNNQLITMDFGSEATISSFELLDQINLFRSLDAKKSKLAHRTLLSIIRDEFSGDEDEDLQEQRISKTLIINHLNLNPS